MITESKQASLLAQMQQMAAAARADSNPTLGTEQADSSGGFPELLQQMVNQVNDVQKESARMSHDFAIGESQADLAEVMVAMQKARVHFETMLQVRNRLVSAYEEIMRMPV
jgi:flagellar hook-basal body complex protein FliE